jgi:hypothetical protein
VSKILRLFGTTVIIFISIISILIIVYTLCTFGYPEDSKERRDLLLSMGIELLGAIVVAVALDRVIRRAEARRWLPAKCIVYADIIHKMDDFLCGTFPPEAYKANIDTYICKYGGSTCTPGIEKVSESWPTVITCFDAFLLTRTTEWLDDVLGHSAFLLEPESINSLVRLRERLRSLLDYVDRVDWGDARSRMVCVQRFKDTVWAALAVRDWLQEMLSQHFEIAKDSDFAMPR